MISWPSEGDEHGSYNSFRGSQMVIWFGCAVVALLPTAPAAKAGIVTDGVPTDGGCPAIADKPDAIAHVDYQGVEHKTYCYGPMTITPGQNIIRSPAGDRRHRQQSSGPRWRATSLASTPSSSTPMERSRGSTSCTCTTPSGASTAAPQFAVGEEKTIQQLPQGFGWPSQPGDSWVLNDMLHDLVEQPAQVYLVWRVDFVPDDLADSASIHPVHTKWMDVAGNPSLYPVFDALRSDGHNGSYTFPDQAPASDLHPCDGVGGEASWPAGSHGCLGAAQSWTVPHDETLIGTAGHLHPGGLDIQLRDTRGGNTNTLFTSDAHYYEPAGEVSWDVSMGATSPSWRVQVQAGDR